MANINAKLVHFGTEDDGKFYTSSHTTPAWTAQNDPEPCVWIDVYDPDKHNGVGLGIRLDLKSLKEALRAEGL